MTHLAVVIAVYKSEGCLAELHRRLLPVLESITADFEVLFVEDCGEDSSWDLIKGFAARDSRIKAIKLSRNFGQHYAITAGLHNVKADWVVVMDCDLQDDPEVIPQLYRKAQEGYDLIMSHRVGKKHSWRRRVLSACWANLLGYFSNSKVDSGAGTLSIISAKVHEAFLQVKDYHRHYMILLRWLGFKSYVLDIQHHERFEGKSSYSFSKLVRHAIDGFVAQSNRLLILSVFFGLGISLLSLLVTLVICYRYYINAIGVPGWASEIVVTFFIGGSIHISIGILGLYLGKTFEQTKNRPMYFVDERLNFR